MKRDTHCFKHYSVALYNPAIQGTSWTSGQWPYWAREGKRDKEPMLFHHNHGGRLSDSAMTSAQRAMEERGKYPIFKGRRSTCRRCWRKYSHMKMITPASVPLKNGWFWPTMNRATKACVVVTVGAALGLKEMPKPSSMKQNWASIGSARAQVNLSPDAPGSSKDVRGRMDIGKTLGGAEDSLRMVLYLSCWGPN
ncbi:hypothetical protein SAY86_016108 [Trapa natans]|uniref:Uncharacterized protein n=1 Tax=Trapa natans TaxID=22666 RepID=A0AAN7L9S3_TRANT|nr:hypothetical protein SAY86_016108 [Trapa natans]